MVVGSGKYTYQVVKGWGQEAGNCRWSMVSAVACDSQDRVYVFNRFPRSAILVFDREGQFLYSWGEGVFTDAHGIWISADDRVFITDIGDHTVRIYTTAGRLLQTLGTPGQPSATGYDGMHPESIKPEGGPPFNRPTWAVEGPSGAIYVSDGYGNTRVHKFAPDGTLLLSWGGWGKTPGKFTRPHTLGVDRHERLYVGDRRNERIQVFDSTGRFLAEWKDVFRQTALFVDNREDVVYVAEAPAQRVSIFSLEGELISRWGDRGIGPGQFCDILHGICVDSRGDLYVNEVEPDPPSQLTRTPRGSADSLGDWYVSTPHTHNRLQKFARL